MDCEREPLDFELSEGSTVAASETTVISEDTVVSEVDLEPVKNDFQSIMEEKNYEHLVKTVFPSTRAEEMELLIKDIIDNNAVEFGTLPGTYLPSWQ
jgi:hypothetical protein